MNNKLLVALVAVLALGTISVNAKTDKIYDGAGLFSFEYDVRADKKTKIIHSNLNANGTLAVNGIYTVKGARTLTLPAGPKIGDSVEIYRGDNGNWASAPVVLTNGSDAALIEDSTSNYTVNGTGLSSAKVIYVGTDDGWRVIED